MHWSQVLVRPIEFCVEPLVTLFCLGGRDLKHFGKYTKKSGYSPQAP